MPKLDRLVCSGPTDPMGKLFFDILATFAEFSVISTRRDGHLLGDEGCGLMS